MRYALLGALALAIVIAAIWAVGPREPVAAPLTFDPEAMGDDLDAYLYRRESAVPGIKRGAQKHILWIDPAAKTKTPLSVVYVHGFSATLQEIRPVPDEVARALGANLFYTRLAGHGRNGAAMAEASVPRWRDDLAEALEIGRRIGERVIVIATSTGATLTTLALLDEQMNADIAGVVLISPNYGVKAGGAGMLTWPFARQVVPLFLGRERAFAPENIEHAKWWTTRYPTTALMPMAAAVKAAAAGPVDEIDVPALFIFSDADEIVRADLTRRIADRWGGRVSMWPVEVGPQDDRLSHIIAGDILSPGLTEAVIERILEWVRERSL